MDFKILIRHRTDEGILLGYTLQNCVTGEKLYYTSQQLQLGIKYGLNYNNKLYQMIQQYDK